jgi:hypothetical protein
LLDVYTHQQSKNKVKRIYTTKPSDVYTNWFPIDTTNDGKRITITRRNYTAPPHHHHHHHQHPHNSPVGYSPIIARRSELLRLCAKGKERNSEENEVKIFQQKNKKKEKRGSQ